MNKEQSDISLNGGILIIGSLLWDPNPQRAEWRESLLRIDKKVSVPAPICYGRVSTKRKNTFSMVFSNNCNDTNQMGTALFVPFKNNPVNFRILEEHTLELIKSERKKKRLDSDIHNWEWGALAISVNPKLLEEASQKFDQARLLLAYWQKKYSHDFNTDQYKVGVELPILNGQGILNFNWNDNLNDFDFLIATATKPNTDHYPTSKDIAERMIENDYEEYFWRNVESGISTYQDEEIGNILRNK